MEIVLDVWEGALDINEPLLREAGVAGLIVRLNDISGGLHKDMTFDAQWKQAEGFLRAPYYVYNPWVTGQVNFEWLADNLPAGVTRVFADIEVRKADYPPSTYADEVQLFYALLLNHFKAAIYTGGWFLSMLSHWYGGDYWWARYPYALCPQGDKVYWTWGDFKQKANVYGYHPDPTKQCPGRPILWQCSGDKVILPGTASRPMDLTLWNGSLPELEAWWGAQMPNPPMDWAHALTQWAKSMGYVGPEPG